MGLFPSLDVNINATIDEFLTVLRSIDAKLDTLIELEQSRDTRHRDALSRAYGVGADLDYTEDGQLVPVGWSDTLPISSTPEGTAMDINSLRELTDEQILCGKPLGKGICRETLGHTGRCR